MEGPDPDGKGMDGPGPDGGGPDDPPPEELPDAELPMWTGVATTMSTGADVEDPAPAEDESGMATAVDSPMDMAGAG